MMNIRDGIPILINTES